MFWPRLALGLAAVFSLMWTLGPRDRLRMDSLPSDPPPDARTWLAEREAGIRPEVASYLQWAEQPGQPAALAILYVHGFSASPAELRPLPEDLARRLDANLLAIRLTGHGQGGAELAAARAEDWWRDLTEGLAMARGMGRRVVVLGMSTGATLAAQAARDPRLGRMMDGVVLISPNFALKARNAWMLDLPFMRPVLRLLGDPQRCFATRNDMHRARWTSCYPVSATLALGAVIRQGRQGDYRTARPRALFVWAEGDRIIDHRASERVAAEWGGGATVIKVEPGPNDDPDAHVIAGEALSPDLTRDLLPRISDWVEALP
ncbi:alpha/beta fold hydrolase [Paracoccus sp. WLY502]|uniref:alpha/beta hydrolase n=1 Tax=Paracoccus yibinensis TaxID=3068891 RepID=UPI002796DEF1|nr:alpha/beta fold hydrolase [Paracoccus sp. WLY502]MDQ1899080.1 alpha/beta fold hydrolase [Paracoccus sp. WLY502]